MLSSLFWLINAVFSDLLLWNFLKEFNNADFLKFDQNFSTLNLFAFV